MALEARVKRSRIAELLLASGHITREQLDNALEVQRQEKRMRPLGKVLVDLGYVSMAVVAAALATQMGLRFIDLSEYRINPEAVAAISEPFARRYLSLPIDINRDKNALVVAMSDPTNVLALDDLQIMTGYSIEPVVVAEDELIRLIDKLWKLGDNVSDVLQDAGAIGGPAEMSEIEKVSEVVDDAPIVKLVNLIISQAIRDRSSDVHIEPGEKELRVRYRIDGVLHEVMTVPRRIQSGVISRLKIMGDLDIAERRIPQDGRASMVVDRKAIDLRIASCPTVYGEQIVMRILDKSSVLINIEDLGFDDQLLADFQACYNKPYGLILVTGPTGSGKTTTLYATLNVLNQVDRKIITVEDPVEYRLAGINQTQVNPKAGLTFAAGLRSILRLDPDVIMVGEIRDMETAKIAVESSLTGHLVLSTLHANQAAGAVTRLTEMGIEPFLIGSGVECSLAQRLARRLCPHCKQPYEAPEDLVVRLHAERFFEGKTIFRPAPKGCERCSGTGYRGRLGLYELLKVDEDIERLIIERATTDDMTRLAIEKGMRTLRHDGFDRVAKGITSIEEILRVTI